MESPGRALHHQEDRCTGPTWPLLPRAAAAAKGAQLDLACSAHLPNCFDELSLRSDPKTSFPWELVMEPVNCMLWESCRRRSRPISGPAQTAVWVTIARGSGHPAAGSPLPPSGCLCATASPFLQFAILMYFPFRFYATCHFVWRHHWVTWTVGWQQPEPQWYSASSDAWRVLHLLTVLTSWWC